MGQFLSRKVVWFWPSRHKVAAAASDFGKVSLKATILSEVYGKIGGDCDPKKIAEALRLRFFNAAISGDYDESPMAVNLAVQDVIHESRIAVTRTISVAGAFMSAVLFMMAAVGLWFLSRVMPLNRLAHLVTGNPVQVSAELEAFNNGEAVYRVQGKLGVHKMFVQAGSAPAVAGPAFRKGLADT